MATTADNALAKARALQQRLGSTPAAIATLRARVKALEDEVAILEAEVGTGPGGSDSTGSGTTFCTSYVQTTAPAAANLGDLWSTP
jgi:hypothetical protein